jgi:hypothetical protein
MLIRLWHGSIYIRTYAQFGGEDFRPTKKGVSMNVDLFPHLLEAVDKLSKAVAELK